MGVMMLIVRGYLMIVTAIKDLSPRTGCLYLSFQRSNYDGFIYMHFSFSRGDMYSRYKDLGIDMELLDKLIEIRKSDPITWEVFAHKIGVSRNTLNKWKNGQKVSFIASQKIVNFIEKNS
jgi:DNA-binding XRE family transcriptional regulator